MNFSFWPFLLWFAGATPENVVIIMHPACTLLINWQAEVEGWSKHKGAGMRSGHVSEVVFTWTLALMERGPSTPKDQD